MTAHVAPGTVARRTVGVLDALAPKGRTTLSVVCAGETMRVVPLALEVFNDSD